MDSKQRYVNVDVNVHKNRYHTLTKNEMQSNPNYLTARSVSDSNTYQNVFYPIKKRSNSYSNLTFNRKNKKKLNLNIKSNTLPTNNNVKNKISFFENKDELYEPIQKKMNPIYENSEFVKKTATQNLKRKSKLCPNEVPPKSRRNKSLEVTKRYFTKPMKRPKSLFF